MFVEYADSADLLLVPARSDDGEISLLLLPRSAEGIDTTPLESISRDPQYAVQFDNVLVDDGAALGGGVATMKRLLDRATVLHCAQSVGGAQQVLEMTVAYTKQRVQFDRAIATFQSVQHHCADMVMAIDAARLATYEAITRMEDGQTADKEIALAKALTNVDHPDSAADTRRHRLHGGVRPPAMDAPGQGGRVEIRSIVRPRRSIRRADGAGVIASVACIQPVN